MKREEKKIFWMYVFAFGMAETVIACMWCNIILFSFVNNPYKVSFVYGFTYYLLGAVVFPLLFLIASFVYSLLQLKKWIKLQLYHGVILLLAGSTIAYGIFALMAGTFIINVN